MWTHKDWQHTQEPHRFKPDENLIIENRNWTQSPTLTQDTICNWYLPAGEREISVLQWSSSRYWSHSRADLCQEQLINTKGPLRFLFVWWHFCLICFYLFILIVTFCFFVVVWRKKKTLSWIVREIWRI